MSTIFSQTFALNKCTTTPVDFDIFASQLHSNSLVQIDLAVIKSWLFWRDPITEMNLSFMKDITFLYTIYKVKIFFNPSSSKNTDLGENVILKSSEKQETSIVSPVVGLRNRQWVTCSGLEK